MKLINSIGTIYCVYETIIAERILTYMLKTFNRPQRQHNNNKMNRKMI